MSDPYAAFTADGSVLGQYILTLLRSNLTPLGLQAAWYGDQVDVPQYPAVCVEPPIVKSHLAGVPMMLQNDFTCYLLVLLAKIQDKQATRLQCTQLAEAVRDLLHTDKTMGGNLIQGWVTEMEPGFARRQGYLMVADRITFTGLSKKGV